MIITISGLLGAGKSTLVKALQDICNYTVFMEPTNESEGAKNNPFLTKYYEDPHRYALGMQIFLMFERVKQTQEAYLRSLRGETIVLDSNIYSDMAFAKIQDKEKYFIPEEFELYKNLYDYMTVSLPKPDLFFWLELKPEDALKRINQRSRECESNIPIEYLRNLYEAYQSVLKCLEGKCKIIRIDARPDAYSVLRHVMEIIANEKLADNLICYR